MVMVERLQMFGDYITLLAVAGAVAVTLEPLAEVVVRAIARNMETAIQQPMELVQVVAVVQQFMEDQVQVLVETVS
jgi:hypothetical protein